MVTIQQRQVEGGYSFEIADFHDYLNALQAHGIEPPGAEYRFFVSFDDERKLKGAIDNWRRQLQLFYRLGDCSGIPCQFSATAAHQARKDDYGQETNDNR